jgi:ankyrin repeat protein
MSFHRRNELVFYILVDSYHSFVLGPFNTFPKRPAFIVCPEKGRGPLHIAALCTLNGVPFIKLLLAAFDDQKYMNFVDFDGTSALHIAVSVENQAVVKFLLDRGIDCSLVGKNGFTALDLAQKAKYMLVVELLTE